MIWRTNVKDPKHWTMDLYLYTYMFRSAHPQTEFEVYDTEVNVVWTLHTVGGNPASAAGPARAGT